MFWHIETRGDRGRETNRGSSCWDEEDADRSRDSQLKQRQTEAEQGRSEGG
jgi:hypothetical protein